MARPQKDRLTVSAPYSVANSSIRPGARSNGVRMQDHIQRYCVLITYTAYLMSESRPGGAKATTFQAFLRSMPEIESAVDRLLRRFPLLSLELEGGSEEAWDKETGSAIAVRCRACVRYEYAPVYSACPKEAQHIPCALPRSRCWLATTSFISVHDCVLDTAHRFHGQQAAHDRSTCSGA